MTLNFQYCCLHLPSPEIISKHVFGLRLTFSSLGARNPPASAPAFTETAHYYTFQFQGQEFLTTHMPLFVNNVSGKFYIN